MKKRRREKKSNSSIYMKSDWLQSQNADSDRVPYEYVHIRFDYKRLWP